MPNTEISLQMTIRSGSPDGAVVYAETHDATTNAFGLVNLVIGYGVPQSNAFADIDWASGEKYLETAINLDGGGSYTVLGVTQFLSVPYAMHSQTAESYTETDPDFNAWDKSTGIAITENQINDLQDYLIQEVDPSFNVWDKSTGIVITEGQISDLQDYLTEEVDPDFNAWDKSTGIVITEGQISNLQEYLTQEVDPDFNAWDKSTGIAITENQINDLQDYLIQEVDPSFNVWDKSTGIVITEGQISDLQDYLTEEVDPDFNAWDKSTGIVITENQISDLEDYLTEEVDPDFNAWDKSTGIVISEGQIVDLQDYLTEELDGDPVNELQVVEEQDYEVTLSQGGGSFMTGVKSYTQAAIDAMTPYNGLTVHNSNTNCINYYYLNNWFEACGTCTPQPTQAIAGNDTIIIGNEFMVNLNANTPVVGDGLWSILIGEGGTFENATNPTTLFTGQPDVDYTLQWSISTVCGTSYDELNVTLNTWSCGVLISDVRDGQSYETVQIGEQCWMAENLNIGTMINGSSNQADNEEIEKYCYNNDEGNCDTYGGLYQWNEMMQYDTTEAVQGICMEGWHLPTDAEWSALTIFLGGESVAGGKLKESGTTHWNSPNTGATNSSGFTGLPGGYRVLGGTFSNLGINGYFWGSTEGTPTSALYRILYSSGSNITSSDGYKAWGFSVRCLRDL